MIRFLYILTSIMFCQLVRAQQQVVYDTSEISVRDLSATAINKYKSDPAFQYDIAVERPRSWWERFWNRFWERIGNMLSSEGGIRATEIILIALSIIILVCFIVILLGMGKGGLFGKKNNDDPLDYSVAEDDIHAINFDAALELAINNKNFRFAVRLLYLQTLKNLTDAGVINWQVNKTNIAYLNELNGKTYQPDFRKLTLQFESNWYGDLPIDANEFQAVRDQFNQFNHKSL